VSESSIRFMSTVLVTGGSGFVGSHTILQLLAAGHTVRTTVRNMKRADDARALWRTGGAAEASAQAVTIVEADLMKDDGWADAVRGAEYVLHVASPFPTTIPKNEDDVVVPARQGVLRVLRAARDAGVKRVVLTSSFAAVGYGKPARTRDSAPFDETSWTDPTGDDVRPYVKSKTLAERDAWEFVGKEGAALELAVINPAGIFGPVLGADYSTSILMVQRLMAGAVPGCPRIHFGVVDVRDVAALHVIAMTHPAAKGERFVCVSGDFMTMLEIATTLRARLGDDAKRCPTRELPNWMVRVASLFDPSVAQILPELGKPKNATADKAKRMLGWTARTREDAIVATGESLVRLGLLKRR
jgi:nucleoside-diphosphate-sugar epimerase